MSLFEYEAPGINSEKDPDGLFLDRLDAFLQKCLADIKAFAERELRPYEETRRCVAQWHAKYLFHPPSSTSTSSKEKSKQIHSILCDTSRILESLSVTSGVQSFVLAIDPDDTLDGGFLGGSLLGRDFWRGMRGGGQYGARALKAHCLARIQNERKNDSTREKAEQVEKHDRTPPLKGGQAKSIKMELYETVRNALRLASGIRTAEMKWSNPEKLDVYSIRLIGWPEGIPMHNPSSLKVGQNKILLESIQNGSMRFERTRAYPSRNGFPNVDAAQSDIKEDFSWAYDEDAGPRSPSPPEGSSSTIRSPPARGPRQNSSSVLADSEVIDELGSEDSPWNLDEFPSYSVGFPWDDEFGEQIMDDNNMPLESWNDELNLQSSPERPKKRLRTESLDGGDEDTQ